MKRPSGLWILLSAGVLWLSIQDVYGVRGTSLIFGKSTTTTTTTPSAEEKDSSEDEGVTTELSADGNTTKPTLTGNPQIDYIWDPNLPKELNGYNLSDYPFYERVPKDITFKCDGLHDGFYASVQHKCQVYHHCLHETRYDFLCGNYTAFDQRTFICHFASEVDCNNSKKYWHRNDALYKAASTTTVKPIIYTTVPPIQTPTDALAPPVGSGPRRIRPYRRRRPQYDYYDDYYDFFYEDRPRSRGRKRPRPRPRPIYDDEYEEEYEEERYEKRGGGRRNENRRPYERRPNAGRVRNKERPRLDYEDENSETKYEDDIELSRRKPVGSKESKSKFYGRRHPTGSESEEQVEKPRPSAEKIREKSKPSPDTRAIIKPVSGTIYDRPRLAPKIRLPVPKNEAEKYAYKPLIPKEPVPQENIEYDDDYVEIEASNYDKKKLGERESNEKPIKKSNPRTSTRKHPQVAENTSRNNTPKRRPKPEYEDYEDDYDYTIDARPRPREDIMKATPKTSTTIHTTTTITTTTPTTTTTTTTMTPIEKIEQPLIRNDDLYKAASTTAAPAPYNFYTQAPPLYPLTASPSLRSPQGNYFSRRLPPVQQVPVGQPVPADQLIPLPAPVEPPVEQRPQQRPRLDYYDVDDYEERPRVIYRRKRPRPRPVYYDDYDYYDERPHRRPDGRRRRPLDRRPIAPIKRNQGRRVKYEYEDDEIVDDDRIEEDDRFVDDVSEGNRKRGRKEERPVYNRRRQPSRYKRPIEDDLDDYEEDYAVKEKRRKQPPISPDYDDEPLPTNKKGTNSDNARISPEESRVMIKPKTGTLYDRPRVAPRINLPVPKNVAKKYAYKPEESDTLYDDNSSAQSTSERVSTTTESPQESTTARKRPVNPRRNNRNRSGANIEERARNASAEDDEIQERRADMKQAPIIVQSPLLSDVPTEECSRNCRGGSRNAQSVSRSKSNPQKTRMKVFRTLVSNRNAYDTETESRDDEKIIDIDKLYGKYDASLNEA